VAVQLAQSGEETLVGQPPLETAQIKVLCLRLLLEVGGEGYAKGPGRGVIHSRVNADWRRRAAPESVPSASFNALRRTRPRRKASWAV